ncbi:MAG: FHA domain-containing protein [Fimbriimonas sp.]
MQLRPLILVCLSLAATFTFGQASVFVTFPDAAPRELWIQTGLPSEPPGDSLRTELTSTTLPTTGKSPAAGVFVWDKKSGNLASKTLRDLLKTTTWEVKPSDYLDVAEIVVQLEHDGKPVSAAQISLNDGRRTSQEFLDPSMKGEVRFFAVKPGTLKVKVQYKSEGKDAKPVTQILEAPLTRSEAVPTLKISLPDPVETIAPAATTDAATEDPSEPTRAIVKEEPKGSAFGTLLAYLIGIGIAAAAVWFAIQFFKKNLDTVSAKLEQLGVQIPKPQDDQLTQGDPIVPMPVKQAPPQKIMLDDADPLPLSDIAPIAMPSQPTGESRLVAENGDEMPLPDGETVVGREVGLGLSLVGETTVSRRHAQLVKAGSSVVVRDLGSTNGTYVNGAKVDNEVTIRPGDVVQFGSVRFRYEG